MAGRNCLIVGGTGGIGLATARRFLQEGARVVVTGHTADAARAVEALLSGLGPCRAVVADVADPATLDAAFRETEGERLDVLLHVAGISGRRLGDGPLHECSLDAWEAVLGTNARGVFLTNQRAVRRMLAQSIDQAGLRGTVVNVGSVVDRAPSPAFFGTLAYAASKGAVRALTLASAARYADDRVRFNLLAPGLIDTPMAARAVGDPAIRAFLATKQPLSAGPGSADDCAEAALFLCEPASRFLTGVELAVDGGWSVSEGQLPAANPSRPKAEP
jgi:NAD(P)-dependent dehydrogenase (short-subunit alcohol dehydrogenase family)